MINVFDIKRQNKLIGNELSVAISNVISGGQFILGPKVLEFEGKFAKYIGVKYAVGVASGTDALMLALASLNIGVGDEVILPANAYPTAFAVTSSGATPKLVDIDPETYNIDPKKIPQAITKKTKAIIAVHMYGRTADLASIYKCIEGKNIALIEDCAQAHGAEIGKKKVGSIGDIGCFSFYPTKNLGCFGDGGLVVTNNEEIYNKIKLLRMYGEKKRYESVILGKNSRLDEIQAAILLVKLKYLDRWNKRRREIANQYFANISGSCREFPSPSVLPSVRADGSPSTRVTRNNISINLPFESICSKHVYHLFVIRTKERDALKAYLEKNGIGTAIHYPIPIHLVKSFEYLGYKEGDFPQSEKVCREILSLPMYPELNDKEVDAVVSNIKRFFDIGQ